MLRARGAAGAPAIVRPIPVMSHNLNGGSASRPRCRRYVRVCISDERVSCLLMSDRSVADAPRKQNPRMRVFAALTIRHTHSTLHTDNPTATSSEPHLRTSALLSPRSPKSYVVCTHVDETCFLWVHRQERQKGDLVGSLTRQRLPWLAKMGDSGMSLFALSLEQLTQLKQSIEEVRLIATMNAAPV